MEESLETFGSRVRSRRKADGMTQEELANEVGISRTYLSQIEQGRATNLSLRLAQKLSETLGMDVPPGMSSQQQKASTSPSLREFAEENDLSEADVQMLSGLKYRGKHPERKEQWSVLYQLIKTTIESG